MIIYSATKQEFINDVVSNQIDEKILTSFVRETGHSTGPREIASWRNSLPYMRTVIDNDDVPDDVGIAIEYTIPQTSKRIDFIITGLNKIKKKKAVIVELKQWEKVESVEATDMDGVVVRTFVGGGLRETLHPSYQVLSYALFLEDYNESIQEKEIGIKPCAYLHNYRKDDEICSSQYRKYIEKAPIFFRSDVQKLQNFIKQHIKYGDPDILYEIENGKIKPSKQLAESLASMLQGNEEFILLDDQKMVYEKALSLSRIASENNKQVLIVGGGPGTGKSVVAINLLSELTNQQKVVQYVTKNSAPREVFVKKLGGSHIMPMNRIRNLFKGSGSYHSIDANTFDVLVVDEAHRLNEKSGLFSNLGENQVKELINASKCTIFFIDEDQRVTLKDIGSKAEIEKWVEELNASTTEMELASQFRCNGSDGYLSWLDNILQVKETANYSLVDIDYDFHVFDSPKKLHEKIIQMNQENNKSRMVAGYTWNWITKKPENLHLYDIEIGNYKVQWNLTKYGQAFIIDPDSVSEIGCIHTCQGLELDYVGVIIGPDLIVRGKNVTTDYKARASTDKSLSGIIGIAREKGEEYAQKLAEPIIKNTYRTLMTRGMKGCYIFSEDEETRDYFRKMFSKESEAYGPVSDGSSIM